MPNQSEQYLAHLHVPDDLNRNAPGIAAAGYERTGEWLLGLARDRCGFESLGGVDLLDLGCGVRFAATIVNRKIPIKSYAGLEVEKRIVQFLGLNLAAHDSRFKFLHWNVHNELYNPSGVPLARFDRLPTDDTFDLICAFSVFTHQCPSDSRNLLRLLRKQIRPAGRLFFSVFIDPDLAGFEDREKSNPLVLAYYGKALMESIVRETGWKIEDSNPADPQQWIQHSFACSPD